MINLRVACNGNSTTPSTAPTRAGEGKKRFMPITSAMGLLRSAYAAISTMPHGLAQRRIRSGHATPRQPGSRDGNHDLMT